MNYDNFLLNGSESDKEMRSKKGQRVLVDTIV
jgi:hypothetical protein